MTTNFVRHFTNSGLDIFDKISVLESIEPFLVRENYPSTSLHERRLNMDLKQIEICILILETPTFQLKLRFKR